MRFRVVFGSMAVLAFAVTGTVCAIPASAQQSSAGSQRAAQATNASTTDANREEMANFDRFLDSHPILERELESNPSLVNDPNYVQSEPDLQIFLSHHPNVKAEIQRDPGYLENHRNPDLSAVGTSGADTARLNQFLDAHRDLALQLKQNPALIDDSTFLSQHADLQTFLNGNPALRNEIAQNPRYLTQYQIPENGNSSASGSTPRTSAGANSGASNSYNGSTASNGPPARAETPDAHPPVKPPSSPPAKPASNMTSSSSGSQPSPATSNTATSSSPVPGGSAGSTSGSTSLASRSYPGVAAEDVARLNQFLEDHRDIAKQLQKNPLLVTDHKFLDKHKDVRRFFDENVRLREVFAEDPGYFAGKNARAEAVSGAAANRELNAGPSGVTGRDLLEVEKFLQKHKDIARQLGSSPALGRDPQYLKQHKDLRRFFDEHAHIQAEFDENPKYFMQRESELEREANVQLVKR